MKKEAWEKKFKDLYFSRKTGTYTSCDKLLDFIRQLVKEEIRGRIEPHLKYCQKQNGLPYCKNCGLSFEDEDYKESFDKMMGNPIEKLNNLTKT